MTKRVKKIVVQYVMLMAGILILLSVVIPHHHHSDGLACYKFMTTESAEGSADEAHNCDCTGHNLAFNSSIQSHITDGDAVQYLFPLLILFDYVYSPEPVSEGRLFNSGETAYIESLHDTWIVRATGLRAPPML